MKRPSHSSSLFILASLLVALVLAACGGAGGGASGTAIPTSTIIPTYRLLTSTPFEIATSEAQSTAEATAGLDPEVVERGKGRYVALACNSCHAENGEGTDKGPSLVTNTLSEGDFIAFLRSGGKLGAAHQFATNKLSITGGAALYQYMLSIRKAS